MKVEMELVQQMENVDERNTEHYVQRLQQILLIKSEAVKVLRKELTTFQLYRRNGENDFAFK